MGSSQTKRSKAEIREQEIDDMLSEISTPEIDFSERKKLMDAIEKRGKEEEELQRALENLTGKPMQVETKA